MIVLGFLFLIKIFKFHSVQYIKPVVLMVIVSLAEFERRPQRLVVILTPSIAGTLSIATLSWNIGINAAVRVIVELEFRAVAGDESVQVPAALEIDCGSNDALQADAAAIRVSETSISG